jgi:hypothetical protein
LVRNSWPAVSDAQCVLDRFAHNIGVDINACPVLHRDHTLIDQHAHAVEHGAAVRRGFADKQGPRRIMDSVGNDEIRSKRLYINIELAPDIGI